MPVRVMVVEDDASIGGSLAQVLQQHGYDIDWQRTAASALEAIERRNADVVLLDLGLPDMDGVELCRLLRAARPDLSIVALTARDTEIDIVLGLDAGADDYITKPFRLGELLARLRAHERRGQRGAGGALRAGAIDIDARARRASISGVDVQLAPKEFDLLALLVRESGNVLTRERIMDLVWDEHWHRSTKTLDMHIVSLRRKLADAGTNERITTLRGIGYRLDTT